MRKYLRFFVFITKHGTYIDGFAGPQEPDQPDMWTARLVLENEPKWLRNFFLCELDPRKVKQLETLASAHSTSTAAAPSQRRRVQVLAGDFNRRLDDILAAGVIDEKEATFCLLDQRTFQCDWATVQRLASHKKAGTKIELFYFLGVKWLHRAVSGLTVAPDQTLQRWWARGDWRQLIDANVKSIKDTLTERFKSELGYRYAFAYPIMDKEDGRTTVMYYMIHASDHEQAPALMMRAYRQAVLPDEPPEQLKIELGSLVDAG